ncbi:hypothetical protein [Paractinoplanes atraurantiacus]|uniref:Uncharacterized protein n=1 Tax=Paractinoplanes atraurantiacus TaxID=1036182 RepID=A0A285IJW3_9ACTN|nr:hypothetical protein [Actinoplanes atraurantiacus]SNY48047.1 hypothetical protein SAMN05421748_108278 [Actinoplanes atraurantiacus]
MIDEPYVLAGFVVGSRWVPPAQPWTEGLPTEVVTASDCLAELLPFGDDPLAAPWHLSLDDAIDTARKAPGTHVLAVSVPAADADVVAETIQEWIGDHPHPVLVNLARRAVPPEVPVLGFEVLGFDAGRFHSWLCYGLRNEGTAALTEMADAKRVADLADHERGTPYGTPEDVTWFPVRIGRCR